MKSLTNLHGHGDSSPNLGSPRQNSMYGGSNRKPNVVQSINASLATIIKSP